MSPGPPGDRDPGADAPTGAGEPAGPSQTGSRARGDFREFLSGFLVEADEHMSTATRSLVALEDSQKSNQSNPRAIRDLFRALHTLKGLSAMVGVEPIVELAHALETLTRIAERSGARLTADSLDLVQRGLNEIRGRVTALARGDA